MDANAIEGLICSDGTLSIAEKLMRLHGVPVVGVPKTIDNDVLTDWTFGHYCGSNSHQLY